MVHAVAFFFLLLCTNSIIINYIFSETVGLIAVINSADSAQPSSLYHNFVQKIIVQQKIICFVIKNENMYINVRTLMRI